jgi:Xaa-Pro aminopeptidase
MDYGHGTGHGVGCFLNVHEGPNGISKRVNYPLEPGQINSIEPGYYEPGWGGIRLENLAEVIPAAIDLAKGVSQSVWYQFTPLTLIPFERALIDTEALSQQEKQWLNHYHQQVSQSIDGLSDTESDWLKRQTAFIR